MGIVNPISKYILLIHIICSFPHPPLHLKSRVTPIPVSNYLACTASIPRVAEATPYRSPLANNELS